MQLRARDGRAVLAGDDDAAAQGARREVDPHNLALGADLADALHEWAKVADAVARAGQMVEGPAGSLVSRRGRQLAARLAAAMGVPVSYADPLTGEVTEIEVPEAVLAEETLPPVPPPVDPAEPAAPTRHRPPAEPTPWGTGLTLSGFTGVLVVLIVVALSLALGEANRWLPLIANLVIALGLAPSVWLARHVPVWRWVAYGVVGGLTVAWIALLFTAL